MKNTIETIYILENPEKNITEFATGYQIRYADVIKDVFGVACINDIQMMIQFNKSFQDSICQKNNISGNKISIEQVLRVASRQELLELRNKLVEKMMKDSPMTQETNLSIPCPFDTTIHLQEGIFHWDENKSSYISAKQGA